MECQHTLIDSFHTIKNGKSCKVLLYISVGRIFLFTDIDDALRQVFFGFCRQMQTIFLGSYVFLICQHEVPVSKNKLTATDPLSKGRIKTQQLICFHRSQCDKLLTVVDFCKDSVKILEAGYATEHPNFNQAIFDRHTGHNEKCT